MLYFVVNQLSRNILLFFKFYLNYYSIIKRQDVINDKILIIIPPADNKIRK